MYRRLDKWSNFLETDVMNDANRNTRTLIVSFVIAIMALIPLRFIEAGQGMMSQPQVLGEEIILPDDVDSEMPLLEAPYNEIESQQVLGDETAISCIAPEDAKTAIADFSAQIETGELSGEEVDHLVGQMIAIEENTCK